MLSVPHDGHDEKTRDKNRLQLGIKDEQKKKKKDLI